MNTNPKNNDKCIVWSGGDINRPGTMRLHSDKFRNQPNYFDGDVISVVVDMNKKHIVKNQEIESKCKWSPFNEYEFKGKPEITIINGKIKMKNGKISGDPEGLPLNF